MAEKIATRAAYGEALAALGEHYPQLVVLDLSLIHISLSGAALWSLGEKWRPESGPGLGSHKSSSHKIFLHENFSRV